MGDRLGEAVVGTSPAQWLELVTGLVVLREMDDPSRVPEGQ